MSMYVLLDVQHVALDLINASPISYVFQCALTNSHTFRIQPYLPNIQSINAYRNPITPLLVVFMSFLDFVLLLIASLDPDGSSLMYTHATHHARIDKENKR